MKKDKILYKIKSLEKLIVRYSFNEHFNMNISCPTPTQMQIMEYVLNNQDTNIYQKDLENVLGLRRATVSGVLQTMEKNGLIDRVVTEEDARVKKIILNVKAKKIFDETAKKLEEINGIITKNINEEDLIIFSNVIDIMKDNIIQNCKLDLERSKDI